jgi:hypothetical protein
MKRKAVLGIFASHRALLDLKGLDEFFFFLSKRAHPEHVGQILFSNVRGKLYLQLKRTGIYSRSLSCKKKKWLLSREKSRSEELTYSQEGENFHVIRGTRNFITSTQHLLRQITPVQTFMPHKNEAE